MVVNRDAVVDRMRAKVGDENITKNDGCSRWRIEKRNIMRKSVGGASFNVDNQRCWRHTKEMDGAAIRLVR